MKQFISNLKLRRKFALIGVLVLAMVALPAWLVVRNSVATLSMVHAEAAGIAPSGDVLALIRFTQQHRARSAMVLAGNDSVQAERQAKQAEVEQIMAKAQRSVAILNDPRLGERLAVVRSEWHAIADAIGEKSIDGPQSFVRHTALIARLLALLDDIVDSSTLSFGSDAAVRHIVLSALGHLPRMNESLGQMRGLGALLLTRGEITREDRMRIVAIGAMAQQQLGSARGAFGKAMDVEPEWRRALGGPMASAAAAAEAALKLADEQIVRAETPSLASADYVASMTKAIDIQFDLVGAVFKELDSALSDRVAAERHALWLVVVGGGVPGILALWIIGLTARTTTSSIRQAVELAQNVAAGDLTSKIEVTSSDESGHLLTALNGMADRLETTIGELQLAAAVFDNSLDAIVITDSQGTILKANAAATRVTGRTADELLGRNPRIFQSGRHDTMFYAELWQSVMQTGRWQGEIWNRRKNGDVFPEFLSISAIRDTHGAISNYIGIFMDISGQKEKERHLHYLASHDRLTGLPNRGQFHDWLLAAMAHAKRNTQPIAVLLVDLDHFKYINDTFSHATGDELLRAVTQRIQACLRENETLSRISGDEFALLFQHSDSREEAGLVADKILSAMKSPFNIGEYVLHISVSIGISTYPEDGDHPQRLLRNADVAMRQAKSDGRARMLLFRSGMESCSNRLELEHALHHALERKEFLLFYQPQFDLNSGRLIGVEALLRWQRPEVGLVSPQDFIPLSEESGLIVPIGEWVLRTACMQGNIWREASARPIRIAVNISAQQFSKADFCGVVDTVLSDTGFPSDCLELELTESLAMYQVEETVLTLNTLKALGVKTAIDDFGTGFSSLSYLKRFSVDSLKIDKSFVDGIVDDPNDAAIVLAIITMAHSLGLGVIAEGVETQEQLDFLKMHHCDAVQGFLLGRPMPAGHIEKLLTGPDQSHKELAVAGKGNEDGEAF